VKVIFGMLPKYEILDYDWGNSFAGFRCPYLEWYQHFSYHGSMGKFYVPEGSLPLETELQCRMNWLGV